MSDTLPGVGEGFGGEDPQHQTESNWKALQGGCGTPNMQPAGLNMNQGEPAQATGTSDPAPSDLSMIYHAHDAGTPGAAANGREDSQANVF